MPSKMSGMDVRYELPTAIRSVKESWSRTATKAGAICALFAVVEAQLLLFVKDPQNFPRATSLAAIHALLIFTYSAFLFAISGAVSSLVLVDVFGEIPVRAARSQTMDSITAGTIIANDAQLLEMFGARRSLRWWRYHWATTVACMSFSIIIQILLYVWLQEARSVQITATCIAAFAVLPLFYFVPHSVT
ncbi:hypothetical protein BDW22DRAFT_339545 [Trametopsis cervina]|nr:hypothetical protein BDW22DRAFT_339545 [Trametopsis cervina]